MERLDISELDTNLIFRTEHQHRYLWASRYASGHVCDIACGNGYGGKILSEKSEVESYIGIDFSNDAVIQASKSFSNDKRRYILGSAIDIPLQSKSIDTIVSLETLEHLNDPALAIEEFHRVLKPNGVLVGSVPSKYFDDKAEVVYGKNDFHVTRFTYEALILLLEKCFATVRLYYSSLEIVSHIGSLKDGQPIEGESGLITRHRDDCFIDGSIHFVATNRDWPNIDTVHESQVLSCMSLIDFDSKTTNPLRQLIASNEKMVSERDAYIKELEATVRARKREITPFAKIVRWIRKLR